MEPPSTTTATTIFDLPEDCWKQILSYADNLQHTHQTHTSILSLTCHKYPQFVTTNIHHQTHKDTLSLTSKHFLSITNNLPLSLTLTPPLLHHPTTLLLPLLRRFLTSLNSLSIHSSATTDTVDSALSYVVSTGSAAYLRSLNLSNLNDVPLVGLRHLGSNPNILKVLNLHNIYKLCDDILIDVCVALPLLEEILVSSDGGGCLTDKGILSLAQKLKYLKKISLSRNLSITDKSLISLSDYCLDLCEVEAIGCLGVSQNGVGYVMRHSAKIRCVSMNTLPRSSSMFSIEDSVGFCRYLSTLEFYVMDIEDRLLCEIAKANLPLREFTAFACNKFSLSGFSMFVRAYPKLVKLDLHGTSFLTDEAMKGLVCYLDKLVAINISCCDELTNSMFHILVNKCPALEHIEMQSVQLGKGELGESLVKGDNISCLKLASNKQLTNEMLENIGLMCPNLVHIDLSFCRKLTSEGINKLMICCRELKHLELTKWKHQVILGKEVEGAYLNLELLQLARGNFGDECLSSIAKACPKLLLVNLEDCESITSKGVKQLVESCTKLREINLLGCSNVTSETLAWIVSARPSLRIITPPSEYSPTTLDTELFLKHGCYLQQFVNEYETAALLDENEIMQL